MSETKIDYNAPISIDKEMRNSFFMVSTFNYDDSVYESNTLITSLIRKIRFTRSEILIDYIQDESDTVYNYFISDKSKRLKIHYLNLSGDNVESYTVYDNKYGGSREVFKFPPVADHSSVTKVIIRNISVPYSELVRDGL